MEYEELIEEEKNIIFRLERNLKIANCILYSIIAFIIGRIFLEFIICLVLSTLAPYVFGEIVDNFPLNIYIIVGIIVEIITLSVNSYTKNRLKLYKEKYSKFGKYQVNKNAYLVTSNIFSILGVQYFISGKSEKGLIINALWIIAIIFTIVAYSISTEVFVFSIRTTYVVLGLIFGIIESDKNFAKIKIPDEEGKIMIN